MGRGCVQPDLSALLGREKSELRVLSAGRIKSFALGINIISNVENVIGGSDKLTSVFGYWPSFHDAEVIEIVVHRGGEDASGPTLTATIHVFEMTNEVLAKGSYVCRHHSLVSLRFHEVQDLKLDGFNHQNAIMGLVVKDVSGAQLERIKFEVSFDSAFGVDATFSCFSVEVVSVESGIPNGSIYA